MSRWVSTSILLYSWILLYCRDISHFVFTVISWWTFGLFLQFQFCWIDTPRGGIRVLWSLFNLLWTRVFSTVDALFYIPTSGVWVFLDSLNPSQHLLLSFLKNNFKSIYLFGCVGSCLLHVGSSLLGSWTLVVVFQPVKLHHRGLVVPWKWSVFPQTAMEPMSPALGKVNSWPLDH